jgi:predicted Zn-dependent protease
MSKFPKIFAITLLLSSLNCEAARAEEPLQIVRDAEIEAYLHTRADPLADAAGIPHKDLHIILLGNDEIQAVAMPGNIMIVYAGLLLNADTPNQLDGVIGHELGHLAGGHSAWASEHFGHAAMRPMIITLGLAILAAAAGAPDAAAGLLVSAPYFGALEAAKYSRTQEASADQAALTYLEATGRSGKGLVDMFSKTRYDEVFMEASKYKFFIDHPLSADRIELLTRRAQTLPHYGVTDSPEELAEYRRIVAKLLAFIRSPQETFVKFPQSDTSIPAEYARAIAYHQERETDKAIKEVNLLIQQKPDDPYFHELKGQIFFETGQLTNAEPEYREAVSLAKNSALLHFSLAATLLNEDSGKDKKIEAVSELVKATALDPDNPDAWRLLAQGYDSIGNPGLARLATAEQYFAMGDKNNARIFAKRSIQFLTKGSPDWRRAVDIALATGGGDDALVDK